ncbi:hypothetical protein H0H93_010377, partial [Arthromyces matolae]
SLLSQIQWLPTPSRNATGPVTQLMVDDADSSFQYHGAWSPSPPDVDGFSAHTG